MDFFQENRQSVFREKAVDRSAELRVHWKVMVPVLKGMALVVLNLVFQRRLISSAAMRGESLPDLDQNGHSLG